LTSITTTDPGDEYILTPGANQEIIPGVDSRVVIYGLFGVSAVAGVTAAYLFFRREEPSDVF
jgi:hypothetical protein